MKWLRKLFAVLILLIIVLIAAAMCLVMFVDPNRLKPVIIEEVKKRSGYQLQIEGPLTWSFFPRIGVKIDRMTLRLPPETKPSLDLREVRMAMEVTQLLRGKDKLQGLVHIADIQLANVKAQNADVKLSWKENVLTIHSFKADLYDGTVIATAHGRHLSAMPEWDWEGEINGVQIKSLLHDVNGGESKIKISGTGHIQLKGETQGVSKEQLLSNLNGNSEFNIENGTLDGIDLNHYIQTADALLNKQPLPPQPEANQTLFSHVTGAAVIKNGVAETDNLLLVSPTFTTKGVGRLYLVSQTINLQLQIKSQQAIKTQWEIPVLVTGALARPNVELDMSELEKLVAREELAKVKTKANEIINKHVPGKAGEYLQNLLGK